MTVTFHIPAALREFTAGSSTVEIQSPGQTLTDALAALWMKHPGIRDRVLNEQDQIRQHINIFVGNENVRYTGGLATQVPQQSQISIVPAVSGGLGRLVDNPTPLQIPTLC
jgi:sulfur-carrier protein